ncbi:unnamed protein product [Orchesella dallaii]|uniref:Odorant receptor n=1 Tax=Orchesella dallaii TaxID=48710 RepID=A0ABP1RTJ0_9HEXA
MPNPLVHHAYKLTQFFNNWLFPFIICWDDEFKRWKTVENWRRLIPYYILNWFLIDIFLVGVTVFVFFTAVYRPDTLPFENAIIFTIISMTFPLSMAVDFTVYYYSQEFVKVVNWVDNSVEQYFPSDFRKQWRLGSFSLFLHELKKLQRGRNFDKDGLLLNQIAFFNGLLFHVVPVLLVWGDWDPLYLVLVVVKLPNTYYTIPDLTSDSWVKIIRMVVSVLVTHAMFMNFNTLNIIGLNIVQGYVKLLKRLRDLPLKYSNILNYKQIHIVANMVQGAYKLLVAVALLAQFFGIVVGTSVIIVGLRLGNTTLTSVALLVTVSSVLGSTSVLLFGCSWVERTEEVFHSWRWKLTEKKDGGVIRRQIRGCRKIALAVGGVGTLDDDIKCGFFQASIIYTANLLLAISK